MHMFTIDIYVYIYYIDIYSWNITIYNLLECVKKEALAPDSCDCAVPFASYYIQIDEVRRRWRWRRCGDVDHLISVYVAIYILYMWKETGGQKTN